jgi:uncharacterized membrane protein
MPQHRRCISNFRGYALLGAMIFNVVSDFKEVFPQKFDQRTEYYGVGLMDIGAGAFIVANGLVSHQTRPNFTSTRHVSLILRHIILGK